MRISPGSRRRDQGNGTPVFAPALAALLLLVGCESPFEIENQPTASLPGRQPSPLLYYDGFEHPLSGWGMQTAKADNLRATELASARAGNRALRVKVSRDDEWVAGGPRSEILQPKTLGYWQEGQEYWVGASVLFPRDYRDDPMQEIFWQVHGAVNDKQRQKQARQGKSEKRRASVPFLMQSVGDSIMIKGKGINPVSIRKTKGKWMDFVVHYLFSSQGKGIVQVYVNGDLLIDKHGISNLRPGDRLYQKFGIYKSGWKRGYQEQSAVQDREIWLDEIRIGGADSGFAAVSPGAQSK